MFNRVSCGRETCNYWNFLLDGGHSWASQEQFHLQGSVENQSWGSGGSEFPLLFKILTNNRRERKLGNQEKKKCCVKVGRKPGGNRRRSKQVSMVWAGNNYLQGMKWKNEWGYLQSAINEAVGSASSPPITGNMTTFSWINHCKGGM